MANTAATPAHSQIGLKDVVIAPLTKDEEGESGLTYGTLQNVAGAIDVEIAPDNSDPDIQYFDDIEGDVVYPDPSIKLTMELADLPISIQKMILGHQVTSDGKLVRKAGDTPGYFALGFRSIKTNGLYRYVWMLKGRAAPISETYHTKEGTTLTRQSAKVEWTFIKRTHDDAYQVVADQSSSTDTSLATFLETVPTTFTFASD